jgi:hypothetical protein
MVTFFKSVVVVGSIIILISFLFAFSNRNKKNLPIYLRFFYLYLLLILFLSVNAVLYCFTNLLDFKIAAFVEKTVNIMDFIFWSYFFYFLNGGKSKLSRFFILPAFFITLVSFVFITPHETLRFMIVAVSNFSKCLFCLIYFYKLFKAVPDKILSKNPFFWVSVGVFLYSAVTIPIYLTSSYLEMTDEYDIKIQLFNMTNIAIIIMHLFFIKAQSCIRKM